MNNSRLYLGTCQSAPQIRWDPAFEQLMNDVSGSRKPYDQIYEGTDAMVTGDLTVFNWLVWERIKALPDNFNSVSGTSEPGDIGTLMQTEGFAYTLWCHYPYATKPAFANMVAGHRFVSAFLMGPIIESPGTKANTFHVNFYCGRAYDALTGQFICSDNDMSGILTIPPFGPEGA